MGKFQCTCGHKVEKTKENIYIFSNSRLQFILDEGVHVEEEAQKQLINAASLPIVQPHVAVMPDVHVGKGCTIGSVIPTFGAIIPAGSTNN